MLSVHRVYLQPDGGPLTEVSATANMVLVATGHRIQMGFTMFTVALAFCTVPGTWMQPINVYWMNKPGGHCGGCAIRLL